MTTPAIPAPCEVCHSEPAGMSLMNLADYSNIKVGIGCAAGFFASLATDMVTATGPGGGHVNESGDCPACQQLHDLVVAMTAQPEPEPAPEPEQAPEQAPEPAAQPAPEPAQPAPEPAGPVREPLPPYSAALAQQASDTQNEMLHIFGIDQPDSAPCPACDTLCWTSPGNTTYLCPWCNGRFDAAAAEQCPVCGAAAGVSCDPGVLGPMEDGRHVPGPAEVMPAS